MALTKDAKKVLEWGESKDEGVVKINTFQGIAECKDEYQILDALERRYVYHPKPLEKFPEVKKSLLNLKTLEQHKKILLERVMPAFKSPAFRELWPRMSILKSRWLLPQKGRRLRKG